MVKSCELLETDKNGQQVVVGTLMLDNAGHLVVEPEPGNETLLTNVKRSENFDIKSQSWITFKQNPEAWFDALPSTYNGMHLRARLL